MFTEKQVEQKQIKFMMMNSRKSKKSDVIFLSETHTSYSDILLYDGYKSFMNCRSMDSSQKRGGLVVFIKRNILSGITLVDKSSSEMMWFKLSGAFFGLQRDLYICFIYISPVNSTYVQKKKQKKTTGLDKQVFSKLEDDIVKYNTKGEVMLMGDINAHINCNETDFIINDSNNVLDSFLPTK